jgi:multidrug efflux pump subunit AcrB
MTYRFEDPAEEADHVMPWSRIGIALLFSALVLLILSPIMAVLWLFSAPKSAEELPTPPTGEAPA